MSLQSYKAPKNQTHLESAGVGVCGSHSSPSSMGGITPLNHIAGEGHATVKVWGIPAQGDRVTQDAGYADIGWSAWGS